MVNSVLLLHFFATLQPPLQFFLDLLYKLVTCNLGSVTPYGATMRDVQCSPKQRMVIKNAYYGDFDQTGVFNDDKSFDATCSPLATCRMKYLCNGNESCELTINNTLLPSQYCPDVSKELYTKYTCVDDYNFSAITTGSYTVNR